MGVEQTQKQPAAQAVASIEQKASLAPNGAHSNQYAVAKQAIEKAQFLAQMGDIVSKKFPKETVAEISKKYSFSAIPEKTLSLA